jgi:hypothetical protein
MDSILALSIVPTSLDRADVDTRAPEASLLGQAFRV